MELSYKSTEEIAQLFMDYFLGHDHRLVEPASIIPRGDPTLMLINSGMAPLKPYFTGKVSPPYPRLANIQNCVRFVDIESVGDSHHGTSFRMMGSWSFGDYFKERAIEMAFELLTEGFGFPVDRLVATVFAADESLPGVPDDEESARIWERYLPHDRIIRCPPRDNFWGPAGTSGPCGPCTEVFFDRGDVSAQNVATTGLIEGRHIEIWNAGVFMQYVMDEGGAISPLPMTCVDAGAGLERFAMILQDRASIHEIDQYYLAYQLMKEQIRDDVWVRIILDHLKTSILLLREGVAPSNTREGYLLRRALRRAMTGTHLASLDLNLLHLWAEALFEVIDDKEMTYRQKSVIGHHLSVETENFQRLLRRSEKHFNKIEVQKELDAEQAFHLKTGVGIPEDFLEEFCHRQGILFPKDDLARLMEEHREISRQPKKT